MRPTLEAPPATRCYKIMCNIAPKDWVEHANNLGGRLLWTFAQAHLSTVLDYGQGRFPAVPLLLRCLRGWAVVAELAVFDLAWHFQAFPSGGFGHSFVCG